MRLLSLDPSLNSVGYAYFEGKELKKFGTLKSKGSTLPEKLGSLVTGIPSPPWTGKFLDVAVIELAPSFTYNRSAKYGKSMNQGAMNKMFMATGALVAYLNAVGVQVELIEVHTWKGRGSKETTLSAVKLLYGVEANDHTCDAIMMAHFFLSKQGIHRRIHGETERLSLCKAGE